MPYGVALIRAEVKRGFLRSLVRAAGDQLSLADALNAFQDARFTSVKNGRLIVGSSGSGHSVSFRLPAAGQAFTEDEVFALAEEFQQIYSDCLQVMSDAGNTSPGDAAILAAMLADDRMQSISSSQLDVTNIRFPTYGPVRS